MLTKKKCFFAHAKKNDNDVKSVLLKNIYCVYVSNKNVSWFMEKVKFNKVKESDEVSVYYFFECHYTHSYSI